MSGEPSDLEVATRGADDAFGDAALDAEPVGCGGTAAAVEVGPSWLEIVLLDGEDNPVPTARYRLDLGDGAPMEGRLGADGLVRLEGIPTGRHTLSFPDLDVSAWEPATAPPRAEPPLDPLPAVTRHIVGRAECMASIAVRYGFFWRSLWGYGGNSNLRRLRPSPFVLAPGDEVAVPALRVGRAEVATAARHTFRRKGLPAKIRVCLRSRGRPMVGQPYELECGGHVYRGETNTRGMIEVSVPPDVPAGVLQVGRGEAVRTFRVTPRALNPVSMVDGLQSRLANMGYYHGPFHGTLDAATASAIQRFQRDQALAVDGLANPATTSRLDEVYRGLR